MTTELRLNTLAHGSGHVHAPLRGGRGFGSVLGKTSGRGHKGLEALSGGSVRPGFEGGQMPLQKRVPKFGFTSRIGLVTAEVRTSELNAVEGDVVDLAALKQAGLKHPGALHVALDQPGLLNAVEGDVVDLAALKQAGLIKRNMQRARVFLSGEVTRGLTLRGLAVSRGARQAIEQAGGKVED